MIKFLYKTLFIATIFFAKSFAQDAKTSLQTRQVNNNGFADIVEELMPIAVNISTNQEFSNNGSGFIVSADGYIVTNSHVIEGSSEVNVALNDGSKYKAKIIGSDKKTDIAVIKINSSRQLPFAKFADSSKARIGDWILIIGNPYGLGGSVSAGIISAKGRNVNGDIDGDLIQTDASINKGNSGGPMFNLKGEVVGIATALYSPSGGSVGIGFANPSFMIAPIIKQLKETGEVSRGWIGVSVQDVSLEMTQSLGSTSQSGAFVNDVTLDGPADKAGIVASDIIIKIGNQEINEMKMLPQIISQTQIGKIVPITILRAGKIKIVNVKVAKMPKTLSK